MPVPPSPLSRTVVVSRLRSAGCVFAEEEAALLVDAARSPAELADLVERRTAGLPLEQVLGWAEFCGLRMAVDPGVFVPRRRTELLVQQGVTLARAATDGVRSRSPICVLDMCCGSGALGAALAAFLGPVDLYAVDVDPAAVQCAHRNIASAGGRVYAGDLYEPLPASLRGRVDLIVANAPYVPSEAVSLMPPEARVHEPLVALDGGVDGLDVQRRVIGAAAQWLAPGGHLLVETSCRQESQTVQTFADHGLAARVATCDELDATVVIGTRPVAEPSAGQG